MVAAISLPKASAEMRSLPPLLADTGSLVELVDLASRDLEVLATEIGMRTDRGAMRDHVRVRLSNALPVHLKNIDGEPHFDHDLTHFVREGRRRASALARVQHVTKCPVCNGLTVGMARGTRARVPRLTLPFRKVFIDVYWYRVDNDGYLFQVVDPTDGTTSIVPKGRLLMHAGRWWASAGWSWVGPLTEFQ